MEGNGDWFSYGANADTGDWVVRNGAVIAATDTPISTGNSELFDDTPFAATFFLAAISHSLHLSTSENRRPQRQ